MTEPKPTISIVTQGEIRAYAEINNWGDAKRDQMAFFLDYYKSREISADIIDAYALLDSFSRSQGIRMGKNDLWIAATAHASGSPLVTTDMDFDHLHDKFIPRIYIAPLI